MSRKLFPFLTSVWLYYYTNNILLFSIPLLALHCRHYITNLQNRRILTCSLLIFSWFFRVRFWFGLLLTIELVRFALIYGIPFFLRRISEELPRDHVGETALKRVIGLIRKLRNQEMVRSVNEYFMIYALYKQGDCSEPFSQEERSQFEKVFRNFSRTALVVGERITLFFPSFTVRLDSTGIDFNSESALKLIEGPIEGSCPICHENLSDPGVELACCHRYCLDCILPWFDQKEDCPLCRQPLS